MVVGERKSPSPRSWRSFVLMAKILVAGCDTCTAECMGRREKQVAELAAALEMAFRLEGKEVEIRETSVDRQCIHEFLLDVIDLAPRTRRRWSLLPAARGCRAWRSGLPGKPHLSRGKYHVYRRDFVHGPLAGALPGMRRLHFGPPPRGLCRSDPLLQDVA